MRVIIRPLKNDPWSGIKKYRNCYDYLGSYFTRSGRRYTGLTDEDAKRLGSKLGLDLSPSSEYWIGFTVRTGSKDLYLDTEDPMDELRYLFLKNHKRVKTSIFEKKATADYVMINKDEEAQKVNVLNKIKRDAFREFDNLSPTEIRKALRLYGENADDMSAEVAEQRLFDLIEATPERFLEKWVNNTSRETEVLLARAVSKNVIRKMLNNYKYGSEIIGRTRDEAINFLDKPDNQDIKRSIIVEIDAKDYIDNKQIKGSNVSKINELLGEDEDLEEQVLEETPTVEIKKPKTSKK